MIDQLAAMLPTPRTITVDLASAQGWPFCSVMVAVTCVCISHVFGLWRICSNLILLAVSLLRSAGCAIVESLPTIFLLSFKEFSAHDWPCLICFWMYITCCMVSSYHKRLAQLFLF